VENILVSSLRDNYILQHTTMASQVLVEPAHTDKMTSRGHFQPQPSCDSYAVYYSA